MRTLVAHASYSFFKRWAYINTQASIDAQWMTYEEIKELQWGKLKRLLRHAFENAPYYNAMFQGKAIYINNMNAEEFARIDVLTKDIMKRQQCNLIAFKKSKLHCHFTSGTSANPVRVFRDTAADFSARMDLYRANLWAGWKPGKRVVWLWPEQKMVGVLEKLRRRAVEFLKNEKLLNPLNDEQYCESLTEYIRIKKPAIIILYTSFLSRWLEYIQCHHVAMPVLEAIITTGDTLSNQQRELLKEIFKCNVFNRYGAGEFGGDFGMIASECDAHMGMHISAERFIIEVVDEKNNPVGPGKKGQIVITDLENFGMPIIRYKIGDIGMIMNERCLCGRALPLLSHSLFRKIK